MTAPNQPSPSDKTLAELKEILGKMRWPDGTYCPASKLAWYADCLERLLDEQALFTKPPSPSEHSCGMMQGFTGPRCEACYEAGREAGRAERDEAVLNLTQCLRGLRVWFEEHIEVTDSPGTLSSLKSTLAYIVSNLNQFGAK